MRHHIPPIATMAQHGSRDGTGPLTLHRRNTHNQSVGILPTCAGVSRNSMILYCCHDDLEFICSNLPFDISLRGCKHVALIGGASARAEARARSTCVRALVSSRAQTHNVCWAPGAPNSPTAPGSPLGQCRACACQLARYLFSLRVWVWHTSMWYRKPVMAALP